MQLERGQGLNATFNQYCRERIKMASGWFRFAARSEISAAEGRLKSENGREKNFLKVRGG